MKILKKMKGTLEKVPFKIKFFAFTRLEFLIGVPGIYLIGIYFQWWGFVNTIFYVYTYTFWLSRFFRNIGKNGYLILQTNYIKIGKDGDLKFKFPFFF